MAMSRLFVRDESISEFQRQRDNEGYVSLSDVTS